MTTVFDRFVFFCDNPHAIVSLNSGSVECTRFIGACVCWHPVLWINKWQYQIICGNHIGQHQVRILHGRLLVGGYVVIVIFSLVHSKKPHLRLAFCVKYCFVLLKWIHLQEYLFSSWASMWIFCCLVYFSFKNFRQWWIL
jgi:hypothetical protein